MQFRRNRQAFFIDVEFFVMMTIGCLFAALCADEAVDSGRDRQVIREVVGAHAFRIISDDVLDADDVRGDPDGMVGCLDIIDQRGRGIVVGEFDGCAVRIRNVLGDPFHGIQNLCAYFMTEGTHGPFDFGFVGDDVVVRSGTQHSYADNDFVGRTDFPGNDGLQFRNDGGCADQSVAPQIRTRDVSALAENFDLEDIARRIGRSRCSDDFADLRAGLQMDAEDMVDAVDIAATHELARPGADFFCWLEGELDCPGKFILMFLQYFQRAQQGSGMPVVATSMVETGIDGSVGFTGLIRQRQRIDIGTQQNGLA